jgi:hypothetical protein
MHTFICDLTFRNTFTAVNRRVRAFDGAPYHVLDAPFFAASTPRAVPEFVVLISLHMSPVVYKDYPSDMSQEFICAHRSFHIVAHAATRHTVFYYIPALILQTVNSAVDEFVAAASFGYVARLRAAVKASLFS